MLFYVSVLLQEVPNEVLQVGNSLRTLDLTNNKLGNQILFVPVCYIQLSMDISQVQKEFYVLLIFNVSVCFSFICWYLAIEVLVDRYLLFSLFYYSHKYQLWGHLFYFTCRFGKVHILGAKLLQLSSFHSFSSWGILPRLLQRSFSSFVELRKIILSTSHGHSF